MVDPDQPKPEIAVNSESGCSAALLLMSRAQLRGVDATLADLKWLQGALETMIDQSRGESYPADEFPVIDAPFDRIS